ncbi:MAG: yveL [Sphingomonas bacterium]|nr:AAA family ATPase [Sphingomonas bacterium]MDB5689907.1 yveL [Sphingomonas bacterium]
MDNSGPSRRRGSLLERAAEVYDFKAALERRQPIAGSEPEPQPFAAAPAPAGLIPLRTTRFGKIDREELREAGFILPDAPVSAIAEEFRIVKRQLLLAARGSGRTAAIERGRMILVASAQPDEGKTFCAVNLALSIASEKDVEVLLVDADFAKPEILSILGLEGGPGFIDALEDPSVDVESLVIRTDIPNLSVLPAGRQTNEATELVASERTRLILEELVARNPARIIIFDSPPALAASQASVLALHVGQVLMVVRADRTSEPELREAIGLLKGCGSIQLLLNGTAFAPRGKRFGSYYGFGE